MSKRSCWLALFALLTLAVAADPAAGAGVQRLVDVPLPLALRDGRIARIEIYAIPFGVGTAEPLPGALEDLERLAASWATDCFLTAQAIGHVAPGTGKDGDTLAAHRLARARADRLQAVLVRHGLPEDAIASVWDWQFFIPESRATLWVFQLVPGEDCDGTAINANTTDKAPPKPLFGTGGGTASVAASLPPDQPAAIAQNEPTTAPPADIAGHGPMASGSLAASADPASEATSAAPAQPTSTPAAAEATQLLPSVQMPVHIAPAGDPAGGSEAPPLEQGVVARDGGPEESMTTPSVAPSGDLAAADAARPAPEPQQTAAAAEAVPSGAETSERTMLAAELAAGPGAAPEEAVLELRFDVNSSYLPQTAKDELRRFLERLGEGRWAVRLEGSVAQGDVRNARSEEEARRYNEWITSRRLERVRSWLQRHAAGRIAAIEEQRLDNDPSRRVVIRARRLP